MPAPCQILGVHYFFYATEQAHQVGIFCTFSRVRFREEGGVARITRLLNVSARIRSQAIWSPFPAFPSPDSTLSPGRACVLGSPANEGDETCGGLGAGGALRTPTSASREATTSFALKRERQPLAVVGVGSGVRGGVWQGCVTLASR